MKFIKFQFNLILIILFTEISYANCNFQTIEKINEIDDPINIKKIIIETSKVRNFNKNFAEIITSPGDNIPPKLKKRFSAKIKVIYKFGECVFDTRIRQHGDWKDHVKMKNGMPIRSLDIMMKNGNIVNAVKWKLLIPKTRHGKNEVLGSLILKKLGFISPETFEIKVEINGNEHLMLFQEKVTKELLERNLRREAPIFEGDEELLWSFKEYENFELEDVSLTRLVNKNWFNKGINSEKITLIALQQLQKSYLQYIGNYFQTQNVVYPNLDNNQLFINYFLLLESMNGKHALRPHNRIYYYNIFSKIFEPIYYDGMFELNKKLNLNENLIYSDTQIDQILDYKNKLTDKNFLDNLHFSFKSRIEQTENDETFFFESVDQIVKNLDLIHNLILNKKKKFSYKPYTNQDRKFYLNNHAKHNLEQLLINDIKINENNYKLQINNSKTQSQVEELVTSKELSKIISKNNIDGKRLVFIPKNDVSKIFNEKNSEINKIDFLDGEILFSRKIDLNLNINKKTIKITQNNSNDWILFSNMNLTEWNILFIGKQSNNINLPQNFNNYGFTGCVNFFNVNFDNMRFDLKNGHCEDSLNIVNSNGFIKSIDIQNAFSDALDMDFSNIKIDELIVNKAGNDCSDFSG